MPRYNLEEQVTEQESPSFYNKDKSGTEHSREGLKVVNVKYKVEELEGDSALLKNNSPKSGDEVTTFPPILVEGSSAYNCISNGIEELPAETRRYSLAVYLLLGLFVVFICSVLLFVFVPGIQSELVFNFVVEKLSIVFFAVVGAYFVRDRQ